MSPLPAVPTGIENKCNTILSNVQSNLATVQPAYLASKGRYWQGIRTNATLPADGAAMAPTKTRKPTDQAEDWNTANVTLPALMECAVTVNVYDGPKGKGYEIVGEVEIAKRVWRRVINVGPETHREYDWRDVTPIGTP